MTQKFLTDEQKRALRIAYRCENRWGDKLGASPDVLRDLVARGLLERIGMVNHIPCYKLTRAGRVKARFLG